MNTSIENGNLVIRMPLSPPRPSTTGKTKVIASTGGFMRPAGLLHNGQQVSINLTATVPNQALAAV